MSPTVKSYQYWLGPLSSYLSKGDLLDARLQEHFQKRSKPTKLDGFVQYEEAGHPNLKGVTYLTHYNGLYLGELNDVDIFPEEALKRLEGVSEQSSLDCEGSKHYHPLAGTQGADNAHQHTE